MGSKIYENYKNINIIVTKLGGKFSCYKNVGSTHRAPCFTIDEADYINITFYSPNAKFGYNLEAFKDAQGYWDQNIERILNLMNIAFYNGRKFQHEKMLSF